MKDRLTKIEQMLLQFDMSLDECCSNHQQQGNEVPTFDKASLGQNVPNPFESSTIIPFYIPETAGSANVIVNNIDGKELRNYSIEKFGLGKVTFRTEDLSTGTYMYSLFVNGELIDS
ncbi:MAG: T9SS type A sorting domain-containing protein [Bacteroidia bacterium]|nr:T9SS type A sorting domain-containing protein [Bacteroidia bacterium]